MFTTYWSIVLPIGQGNLIFNGMWSLNLGNSPNYHRETSGGDWSCILPIFCLSDFGASKYSLGDRRYTINNKKKAWIYPKDHNRLKGIRGREVG